MNSGNGIVIVLFVCEGRLLVLICVTSNNEEELVRGELRLASVILELECVGAGFYRLQNMIRSTYAKRTIQIETQT